MQLEILIVDLRVRNQEDNQLEISYDHLSDGLSDKSPKVWARVKPKGKTTTTWIYDKIEQVIATGRVRKDKLSYKLTEAELNWVVAMSRLFATIVFESKEAYVSFTPIIAE